LALLLIFIYTTTNGRSLTRVNHTLFSTSTTEDITEVDEVTITDSSLNISTERLLEVRYSIIDILYPTL
jgi:hypothetical protein